MLLLNENASQSYRDRKLEISTEPTKPRPPNQIAYCLYERNVVNLYKFCSFNIQRKDRTSTQQLLRTKQITHTMKTISFLKGPNHSAYATSYDSRLY